MGIPIRKQPAKTGIKPLQTKAESSKPLMVNKLADSSQSVEGSLEPLASHSDRMTKAEAKNAIKTIKANASSLMEKCYDFATREGYLVLGYTTFKECITNELATVISYDYAHKMKNAGEVHMIVSPDTPIGSIAESVLRPLHRLPDDQKKVVWDQTVQECGDITKVTADIAKNVIKSMGLEKPATSRQSKAESKKQAENGLKNDSPSGVIPDPQLQERLQQSTLEIIKQFIIDNGSQYDSKENFEAALQFTVDNLFNFLAEQYDSLYSK